MRHAETKQPETDTSGRQPVYIIFNNIPQVLTVNSSEQHCHWTFLASIYVNALHANLTFHHGQFFSYDFVHYTTTSLLLVDINCNKNSIPVRKCDHT